MSEIPHGSLFDEIKKARGERRVVSAVFLTFCLEAGFFEEEIIPILFDEALSQISRTRVAQLDDLLRRSATSVAVYYDAAQVLPDGSSAQLAIERHPIRWTRGYFHPKAVLLLVENATTDDESELSLVVALGSANLTKAGWWENVEVAHIEEVREGEKSAFAADLATMLGRVRSARRNSEQAALNSICDFLGSDDVEQRVQKTSGGNLHTQLYAQDKGESLVEFLQRLRGPRLRGLCLEIISPYFDDKTAGPLQALIDTFEPRETRILLPREHDQTALCSETYYRAVTDVGATWGKLPASILARGKSANAVKRTVHAKVYRFFDPRQKYEAILCGSVNLTSAGHSGKGNFETAFLVETQPSRVPDWWLETDRKRPSTFAVAEVAEGALRAAVGAALSVRHDWEQHVTDVYWDESKASPILDVTRDTHRVLTLTALEPRTWTRLSETDSTEIERSVGITSYLHVATEGHETALILVQEIGMASKPSLLMNLSIADILRSWSLLSPEQRMAFHEEYGDELASAASALGVPFRKRDSAVVGSMFDRVAGIFHAFEALDRSVATALEKKGREYEAKCLLFGKKYDSLGQLLDRVLASDGEADAVHRYLILLCTRQLLMTVKRTHAEFMAENVAVTRELEKRLDALEGVRAELAVHDESVFFAWFEPLFLRRAEPAVEVES